MQRLSVVVACEYNLYLEAVCRVLASESVFDIVGEACAAEDVELLVKGGINADLLILDSDMGCLDLSRVLGLIREKSPFLRVLLLSSGCEEGLCKEAVKLACVRKNASGPDLIRSIKTLLKYETSART